MHIVHICLASSYTEGMTYQDNILPDMNAQNGHHVTVISNCLKYIDGRLQSIPPQDVVLDTGVRLIRIPYKHVINDYFSEKMRAVNNFYELLRTLSPDVILFHGLCGREIVSVAQYKKEHPDMKFYADSHEDFHNSARNFLSKNILHKIYKSFLDKALCEIDKVLYVSFETKLFVQKMYGLPESILEFYPLGGIIPPYEIRLRRRNKIRAAHGVKENCVLLVHSGKMEKTKKTYELVHALHATQTDNLKLLIIGSITDEVAANVMPIVESDPRIEYLGWKSGEELMDYLCAADLYVQPGTQSATMQNALCCGSAAALYPYESHKFLLGDSVFYIESIEDMKNLFSSISNDRSILEEKRAMSNKIARERLDYKILAARLYK